MSKKGITHVFDASDLDRSQNTTGNRNRLQHDGTCK